MFVVVTVGVVVAVVGGVGFGEDGAIALLSSLLLLLLLLG